MNEVIYFFSIAASSIAYFGFEITRLIPFLLYFFTKRFRDPTPREEERFKKIQKFPFMRMYGFCLFLFFISLCCSLITPIIVPITCICFVLAYITAKYQIFYVYDTIAGFQCDWWPTVFDIFIMSLIIFQSITCIIISLKSGQLLMPALCICLLPIISIVFWISTRKYLKQKLSYIDPDNEKLLSVQNCNDHKLVDLKNMHPAMNFPLYKMMLPLNFIEEKIFLDCRNRFLVK